VSVALKSIISPQKDREEAAASVLNLRVKALMFSGYLNSTCVTRGTEPHHGRIGVLM